MIAILISPLLPPKTLYIKRVAGLPGERLRILNGRIYANDVPSPMTNITNINGEIVYESVPFGPPQTYLSSSNEAVTIPTNAYFVIGDNSTNSYDSRYWGFVRSRNILGRICYCYWPPQNVGKVK